MNEPNVLEKSIWLTARLLALACALAWCPSVHASSKDGPKVGDKPPLLRAASLLQAPPGTTLDAESLRGKVVVLEFWATWCGPCVASIPHLNQLADRFTNQPVQFVAITAEDEAKVKPFLARRPIHAWVALDTDNAMNKAYGVTAIPHTVVLGRDGRIAAITYPTVLTEQHLTDLLAGKKISLSEPASGSGITAGKDPDDKSQAQPLFQILVRPSAHTNSSGAGGGGRFTASGYTIRDLLPRAFDQSLGSSARLLVNALLPEGRYDFIVTQTIGPAGNAVALEKNVSVLLQQGLKSAFGLVGRKETREMDVMILKVKTPHAPGLVVSPTPGGASTVGPGIIEGTDLRINTLALGLESGVDKPVFDETGLTNRYDISFKWEQKSRDEPNPAGVMKALEKQLGLELVPARRPVEVIVIERLEKGL